MTSESYLRGEVPVVKVHQANLSQQEAEKYSGVWNDIPNYGDNSPGVQALDMFLSMAQPRPNTMILDIGCGTGEAGLKLLEKGFQVRFLDITDAGLDPKIDRKYFIKQPLWKPLYKGWMFDCGFCCDVLEHLPQEFTMLAVHHILRACTTTWLQIALNPDEFGKAIGTPLHLTVQNFNWWRDRLGTLGNLVDARDMGGKAVYMLRR